VNDLVSTTPRELRDMWLDTRANDATDETLQSYRYRTKQFVEWCESRGLMNINDLTGRAVHEYREDRKSVLNKTSLANNLGTVRRMLEYGVAIEAVEPVLPDKIEKMEPSVSKAEQASDTKLDHEDAHEILEYLDTYHYASRDHALLALAWDTAARAGGLRGLDVEDFDREIGMVEFKHRPESGTPLKNQRNGNRYVSLCDSTTEVVAEYIDEFRHEIETEHGRRPLLTTKQGRIAKNTMRRTIYRVTQPCFVGGCPHDEDPETCEYRVHGYESQCPSSLSLHPIRTGRITHLRDNGMPPAEVAERVDATPETIRQHYDHPDGLDRMETRREFVDSIGV